MMHLKGLFVSVCRPMLGTSRLNRAWAQRETQHAQAMLLCLLLGVILPAQVANALDAGAPIMDAGMDAGMNAGLDAGGGGSSGGATSGQASQDGGEKDAGSDAGLDAGDTRPVTAACSCESKDGTGIHLCTGSFERRACSRFSCEDGTLRSKSCDGVSEVRYCCEMKARDLYTNLYADCTHPNCETGFRSQCADFGGVVLAGPCITPNAVEDPDTTLGDEASCSIGRRGAEHAPSAALAWSCLGLALLIRRAASRVRARA